MYALVWLINLSQHSSKERELRILLITWHMYSCWWLESHSFSDNRVNHQIVQFRLLVFGYACKYQNRHFRD